MNRRIFKNPFIYLIITIAFSYFFWILAILMGGVAFEDTSTTILVVIGGISPLMFGIIFFYINNSQWERRKEYWIRIIDVKRIKGGWYAIIFGLNILTVLIAVIITGGIFGIFPSFLKNLVLFFSDPGELVFFIGFTVAVIFIEEPGWRGYSIENLQERYNALTSSLILGVFWALWHLPMYFIPGLVISEKGFLTLWFWIGMVSIVPQTIIMTWIYNNTQQSVLSAMLFHFMMNFLGEMFMLDGIAKIIRETMWLVIAIIVITYYGSETMNKSMDLTHKEKY